MNLCLRLVILAALVGAPIELAFAVAGPSEAVDVFHCDFEEANDVNYDRWPDGWTRQTGPGYPRYLKVQIEPDEQQAGNCLAAHLDGGAAALSSPPIAVSPHYSYLATCRIRTRDLKRHGATLRMAAVDAEGVVIETLETQPLRQAETWTTVTLGPWTVEDPHVKSLVLGLQLEPYGSPDLFGTAYFDDVTLVQVPDVRLTANAPFHLFTSLDAVRVTCQVTGVQNPAVPVVLRLLDAEDRCLASHEQVLQSRPAGPSPGGSTRAASRRDQGELVWQPPLPDFGYYRVTARVRITSDTELERMVTLAVLPPVQTRTRGEFGWSFPSGEEAPNVREIAALAEFAGLSWVKVPVWFAAENRAQGDDLAWLAERLSRQDIEMVGVLDRPPASKVETMYGEVSELPAALAFADPQVWQPLLDPVLTRLSLKTRWWQLGSDEDISYMGLPGLDRQLESIQTYFRRFSQDSQLGVVWSWMDEDPPLPQGRCGFLARDCRPALTAAELTDHLRAAPDKASASWIMLVPLPAQQYDRVTRVRDLALRMMAAKQGQAGTVIVPDPFDARCGLLNKDGTPRSLLLPWTILARQLGGTTYVGSFTLPAGSQAQVFARGEEALLVVWSEGPTVERLYLGNPRQIRALDLWGRTHSIRSTEDDAGLTQEITTDRIPLLVLGASLPVARLRIDLGFDTESIASIFGRPQTVTLSFTNPFSEGVGGTVRIHGPDTWAIQPQQLAIRAAAGETQQHPFQVRLGTNATCGEQTVRFDFDLRSEEHYRFSVHRRLTVGAGDVTIELQTHMDEHGTLFVEQQLVNLSDRTVDFNCLLFLPNQTRERSQLLRVPRGRYTKTYAIAGAEDLLGQYVWLRAEEISGQNRVLNYQAPIER